MNIFKTSAAGQLRWYRAVYKKPYCNPENILVQKYRDGSWKSQVGKLNSKRVGEERNKFAAESNHDSKKI